MSASLIQHTPSAYDYPLLIKHLLHTPLATVPEQEIVYRDIYRYTYRTLRQRIGRLASGLAALGLRSGDTVAVMDWDSHRYLECYFAVPMMGAVLQTVNIRLSPEQILYTLNHAGANVILCHTDFLPVLDSIKDRLETANTFILLSDEGERPQSSATFAAEYEDLLARGTEDFAFPDFDENARATTFYTTGTTGNPKGVYYSHRQLVLHALAVLGSLASTPGNQSFHRGDVYMPITPMFHVHAWGLPYVATATGVKQVYPGRYLPDALLALIQLKPSMTELDADKEIEYRVKAGLPIQLVDLRIVDEQMQDVPHDGKATGEVVARTPWLTQGYLNDPANSEDLWLGGYLHTRDIGTIDPEGYLLITDRIKDVVKSGGEWISSLAIEDIISQHEAVSEVAVIGIPDEKWGERPLALIVLKEKSTGAVTEQHIQVHVKARAEQGVISKWAVPEVRFIDNLEKTSVGKLDKKVMRQKCG